VGVAATMAAKKQGNDARPARPQNGPLKCDRPGSRADVGLVDGALTYHSVGRRTVASWSERDGAGLGVRITVNYERSTVRDSPTRFESPYLPFEQICPVQRRSSARSCSEPRRCEDSAANLSGTRRCG